MNTLKTMIVSALAVLTISFTALTASASDASAGGWKKGFGHKHYYGYNYGHKYNRGYYGHKFYRGHFKFKKFKKGRKFRRNVRRKFRR
jgi:Spy/CpxP family protein refolding chaperone